MRRRSPVASLESLNTKVQQVKRRSRGFRNRDRFREAIYFHCGGLAPHPACATRPAWVPPHDSRKSHGSSSGSPLACQPDRHRPVRPALVRAGHVAGVLHA